MTHPIYNFCAGPAMLPQPVLELAQRELTNFHGIGASVMEISHRGKEFMEVAAEAEADLRALMAIPANYKVLFMHGGGRGQFAAVPLNLLGGENQRADYLLSGVWSEGAFKEGLKFGDLVGYQGVEKDAFGRTRLAAWPQFRKDAAYIHYCPNETIEGIEIFDTPDVGNTPLVGDFSSVILSKPLDVSKFGIIYAGAQKNIGPSGLCVAIVRDDLLNQKRSDTPAILDYALAAQHESMFNTPPTFAWYLAGLVFKWIKSEGGVAAMAERNQAKANLLYDYIDNSGYYRNQVDPSCRSRMNVAFQLKDPNLDAHFLSEAAKSGLISLKGHRIVGGMRASIYNAMPIEGVRALVEFMHRFAKDHP